MHLLTRQETYRENKKQKQKATKTVTKQRLAHNSI